MRLCTTEPNLLWIAVENDASVDQRHKDGVDDVQAGEHEDYRRAQHGCDILAHVHVLELAQLLAKHDAEHQRSKVDEVVEKRHRTERKKPKGGKGSVQKRKNRPEGPVCTNKIAPQTGRKRNAKVHVDSTIHGRSMFLERSTRNGKKKID